MSLNSNLFFTHYQWLCQAKKWVKYIFFLVCHGYTNYILHLKNSNDHIDGLPKAIDNNHIKCVVAST
jgi:hypothetical protein